LEREAAAAAATAVIESKQVMLAKQAATSHGGLSLIRSSLMKGEKETERVRRLLAAGTAIRALQVFSEGGRERKSAAVFSPWLSV
jgi:hypothetical protein